MTPPAERRSPWFTAAAVAALLFLHAAMALWAASKESVTADEILHVTGGYLYNRYGDFRIHPENGNLPQRVAALPAALMKAPPPPIENNIYWRTSDASVVSHQFFYETGHDHWPMLMAGRALVTVFSMATGLLIFCWTRRLAGTTAGFFALGLYAFDPNVLAHAALTTSDSAAVFFLLAATDAFWRHLNRPTWQTGALSAVVFGLACVAKYSAVLLLPIFALLILWRALRDDNATRRRWLKLAPTTLAAHGAAAFFIIWLFFGFRFSGFAPGLPTADHYIVPWEGVLPFIGWHGRVVQVCRDLHLLPEAFLYGYSWVIQSAQARGAFLAGDYSIYGWVSFFPLAFLWKSTLALLLALVVGVAALFRHWSRAGRKIAADLALVAPLVVLFVIYWAFSLTSHLNIGQRHILPTYPILYILVGLLATAGLATRWRQMAVIAVLIVGQLAASVRVSPHYLAFFNTLAGGPDNGWRLLADSSLDWGQDLPGLKAWLEKSNAGPTAAPVFLSYFGSGEPDYYAIEATRLPFVNGFKRVQPWYEIGPGLYCVSATMLQQVYSPIRGAWTLALEQEYQAARLKEPFFREYWRDPAAQQAVRASGAGDAFEKTWRRYDHLRFARLCHYLRARRPEAVVGYSIFIYRLSADELTATLRGTYSDWLRAVEQAPGRN